MVGFRDELSRWQRTYLAPNRSEYNDWDRTAGRSLAQLGDGPLRRVALGVGIDHDQMRKFSLRDLACLGGTGGDQRFRTPPLEQSAQNLAIFYRAINDQYSGVSKQGVAFVGGGVSACQNAS